MPPSSFTRRKLCTSSFGSRSYNITGWWDILSFRSFQVFFSKINMDAHEWNLAYADLQWANSKTCFSYRESNMYQAICSYLLSLNACNALIIDVVLHLSMALDLYKYDMTDTINKEMNRSCKLEDSIKKMPNNFSIMRQDLNTWACPLCHDELWQFCYHLASSDSPLNLGLTALYLSALVWTLPSRFHTQDDYFARWQCEEACDFCATHESLWSPQDLLDQVLQ